MKPARTLLLLSLLPLLSVPPSFAWGSKGHKIINRLAAQSLPADMPAFMRTAKAIDEIEYLGPEPDRWRSRAEPELSASQAPDHFIDLEYADLIGTLPRQRYQYIGDLYAYIASHPDRANVLRPEKVGFQPYITSEVWERLKSDLRDYRQLSAAHQDTHAVEAAILYDAGWLGHYVGDGSQPLHVTINYNGWTGPNPDGYTTDHTIHSLFESTFVDAAISASDVQPLMTPLHPIGDEWDEYLAYLRHTGTDVEKVYQLEKAHGFDGAGTDDSRQFTAERLAAGASMLRDLYLAAWEKSAEPVPEWHEQQASPAPSAGIAALASPSSAEPVDFDQVFRKPYPDGMKFPRLVHAVDPVYPSALRRKDITGTELVRLTVDQHGKPTDIQSARADNFDLMDAAIDAVRHYRFKPAQYQGHPVAMEIQVEVTFRTYP